MRYIYTARENDEIYFLTQKKIEYLKNYEMMIFINQKIFSTLNVSFSNTSHKRERRRRKKEEANFEARKVNLQNASRTTGLFDVVVGERLFESAAGGLLRAESRLVSDHVAGPFHVQLHLQVRLL